LNGVRINPINQFQRNALKRFEEIAVCRELKITPNELKEMDIDWYDDFILVISKERAIEKANMTKSNIWKK